MAKILSKSGLGGAGYTDPNNNEPENIADKYGREPDGWLHLVEFGSVHRLLSGIRITDKQRKCKRVFQLEILMNLLAARRTK